MASVYCKATGFRQSRNFVKGYRLANDKCEECDAGLQLKPPPGTVFSMLYPEAVKHCGQHCCSSTPTKGVGEVRDQKQPTVYKWLTCPKCQRDWRIYEPDLA